MPYTDFELNRPNNEWDIAILNWITQHYDNLKYRQQFMNGFNSAFYDECLNHVGMNTSALNELLVSKLIVQYSQSRIRVLR